MFVKHQYLVTFFNTPFYSLEDAKWNVSIAFTRQEAKKYLIDENISHFIGEKLHSVTPIKVDEHGNITFGKARKV